MPTYTVSIEVEVTDEAALYESARTYAMNDGGFDDVADLESCLGTQAEPNVSGCLQMLFDPGQSPSGTEIQQCSVE